MTRGPKHRPHRPNRPPFSLPPSRWSVQDGIQVHHLGNGVTLPVVVSEVKADYTPEAKAAGIQGTVGLDTVVLADGAVGDVTAAQSLDTVHGLDEQTIDATRQWNFKPKLKDGKPVAVLVAVEMTFALKSRRWLASLS
jgi:TonB family protein